VFSSFLSKCYLLNIWFNKFELYHFETERALCLDDLNFSSSRLLIADFARAEGTLRTMMKEFESTRMFSRGVHMAVHVRENLEGGLNEVELRSIIDICYHARGRKIVVFGNTYQGTPEHMLHYLKKGKLEYIE